MYNHVHVQGFAKDSNNELNDLHKVDNWHN